MELNLVLLLLFTTTINLQRLMKTRKGSHKGFARLLLLLLPKAGIAAPVNSPKLHYISQMI